MEAIDLPPLPWVRAFCSVAAQRSFARAAKLLGLSPSALSRMVKALEQQLGLALLLRTTRHVELTEAGQEYYRDCEAALLSLHAATDRARARHSHPQGRLRVSAPAVFGQQHVLPHLGAFMQAYPAVQLDLMLADRYVDLVAERIGLAIRIGNMPDSQLIARKLIPNRRILAAAPAYLARHGNPATPEELAMHECLISTQNHDGEVWKLQRQGSERSIRPGGRFRADHGEAVLQMALQGCGVAFLSAVTLHQALQAGHLQQVLPAWSGKETGVYSVFPPGPVLPAARALADFLEARWQPMAVLTRNPLR